MQFVENVPWIARFNANYALGVDGISMPLMLLTTFLTPFVVIAGWQVIKTQPAQYFAAFLMLEGLMIGMFAATDALLFYVFWEAMLVPMFIIIGVWGGAAARLRDGEVLPVHVPGLRVHARRAHLYVPRRPASYSIASFHDLPLTMNEQVLIFFAFLLAFAVKVPMFPVHTWLPDAHVEAPTGGSVILAAILLKMGGYGFIRFSLPITPDASQSLAWLMIALSLIAVVYIGFVALVQCRHEEADRVFVDRAHGLRDARLLRDLRRDRSAPEQRRRAARAPGRHDADAVARPDLGRACSSASACSTTACTAARSATTAASSTRCRSSRRSWCCSRSRTPGCRARRASSASSS